MVQVIWASPMLMAGGHPGRHGPSVTPCADLELSIETASATVLHRVAAVENARATPASFERAIRILARVSGRAGVTTGHAASRAARVASGANVSASPNGQATTTRKRVVAGIYKRSRAPCPPVMVRFLALIFFKRFIYF